MMITGNTYLIEAQIKSPMGWVKVQVSLTLLSDTAFSGRAKLMGFTVDLTECEKAARIFILRLLLSSPSVCCGWRSTQMSLRTAP